MKKSEVTELRIRVREEIKKRLEMNQLLEEENVRRYLTLGGYSTDKKDPNDIRGMIAKVLKDFKVSEVDTNGIYVITRAFDEDSRAPVIYYRYPQCIDEPDVKVFVDVECRKEIVMHSNVVNFERSHIVLNPYNAAYDDKLVRENGFEEVQLDFYEECYKHGQNSAVRKILKKYPLYKSS